MEQEKLRELFVAIKKDDVKSFSFLMTSNTDLNISFGRFPILSLLYLYGSYNILRSFEKSLMPIHNYKREEEPYEAYKKFKSKARKAVRLYQGEESFVYPAEMLAIVDNRFLIDKNYKNLYKNDEIALKIEKIYNLSGEYEISVNLQKITLKKKKLTFKQKLIGFGLVAVAVLFSLLGGLSVALVPSFVGRGTAKSPIKIGNEVELVTALAKGNRYYELESDIVLTTQVDSKDFSGVINGNGFKVVAGNNLSDGLIENLSGTITNLAVDIGAQNFKIDKNYGIIAKNSTGKIENCVISGNLFGTASLDEDINIGLFVATNSGEVKNCTSRVRVSLSNSGATNVYYSNFVCVNDGIVDGCTATVGEVVADTVDIAGIVCVNNGTITDCENYSSLSQTSAKEWHPNVGGIVCSNAGTITGSINHGELFAESTLAVKPEQGDMVVLVGGVACDNTGTISACQNDGTVSGASDISYIYAGGIAARNVYTEQKGAVVEECKATSNVIGKSLNSMVIAGGIVGETDSYIYADIYLVAMSTIKNCGFVGEINTNAKTTLAGGVVGFNYYSEVYGNYSAVSFVNSFVDGDVTSVQTKGTIISQTKEIIIGLERIVYNNHYVKTTDNAVSMNLLEVILGHQMLTPLSDEQAGATGYNTLDEIPEEVKA